MHDSNQESVPSNGKGAKYWINWIIRLVAAALVASAIVGLPYVIDSATNKNQQSGRTEVNWEAAGDYKAEFDRATITRDCVSLKAYYQLYSDGDANAEVDGPAVLSYLEEAIYIARCAPFEYGEPRTVVEWGDRASLDNKSMIDSMERARDCRGLRVLLKTLISYGVHEVGSRPLLEYLVESTDLAGCNP